LASLPSLQLLSKACDNAIFHFYYPASNKAEVETYEQGKLVHCTFVFFFLCIVILWIIEQPSINEQLSPPLGKTL